MGALLLGLVACGAPDPHGDAHHAEEASAPRGPHGGRLLASGDFELELALVERGGPPAYRAWARRAGEPVEPQAVDLRVELTRLGGRVDAVAFAPDGDHLRSQTTVADPHSFE
ncbi:MAG: secretion protein HlyD, partial [Myxococcota bacterium]